MDNGVRYAYTGNVIDPIGQTTRCAACGTDLIVRHGYEITGWNLDLDGGCVACTTPCAGVFEDAPGDWGERRLPIRLGVRTR